MTTVVNVKDALLSAISDRINAHLEANHPDTDVQLTQGYGKILFVVNGQQDTLYSLDELLDLDIFQTTVNLPTDEVQVISNVA